MNPDLIFSDCGLAVTKYIPVSGGDINQALRVYTNKNSYFLKINDAARYPAMFEKEAAGLKLLSTGGIRIPKVIRHGIVNNLQYLLLEWIEPGNPNKNSWEEFGKQLATLHQQTVAHFGLSYHNYIGSLEQLNTQNSDWSDFFTNSRIIPLVKKLFDQNQISKKELSLAESLCNKVNEIFPDEKPALLHGDLWGGNFLMDENAKPVLIDPAVYYGHREMDLGMTRLFGGFDQSFYQIYHAFYPMEKGWENRIRMTQLYPVLVHAVLFGGHYIGQSVDIIKEYS